MDWAAGLLSRSMCVKMIMVIWIIHVGGFETACDQQCADKVLRNVGEFSLNKCPGSEAECAAQSTEVRYLVCSRCAKLC